MTFRNLLESVGTNIITKLMRSKHYNRNSALRGETLYMEFNDIKGAIRLYQKHFDDVSNEYDIIEMGAGGLKKMDFIDKSILDSPDAVAYIKIVFKNSVPDEVKRITKAREESDSVLQARAKEYRENPKEPRNIKEFK